MKPPYGVLSAIDLKNPDKLLFQVPHGDTPDAIRNHPLLKGMNIPKTGQSGSVGVLITKTFVVAGDPQFTTRPNGGRGASLRAYDKQTGAQIGEVRVPAPIVGHPMTYSVNGRQYIVVGVSGGNYTGEYIAFRVAAERIAAARRTVRSAVATRSSTVRKGRAAERLRPFSFCYTFHSESVARPLNAESAHPPHPRDTASRSSPLQWRSRSARLLTPWMGATFPLATMFAAIAFVGVVRRMGAGLVTAIAGWVACRAVLSRRPRILRRPTFGQRAHRRSSSTCSACISIIVLGEAMRAAQRRSRPAAAPVHDQPRAREQDRSALAAGGHRRLVRRRDHQQDARWHHHVVEQGRRAAVRLHRGEAIGQSIHLIVPPELRDAGAVDPRSHPPRPAGRTPRRGARAARTARACTSRSRCRRSTIATATSSAPRRRPRHHRAQGVGRRPAAQRRSAAAAGRHSRRHARPPDPAMVMREIVTRVGLHFDVTRCAYGEVDRRRRSS